MSEKRDVLTRTFAAKRKQQIGEVDYDLFLKFNPKSKGYSGLCKIEFFLKKLDGGILIDTISQVKKILVNGKKASFSKGEFSITLFEGLKEREMNRIEIVYDADYDHTGEGLHQFIDPLDKREYLYSDFEPYYAHRMFPCFDQPDIKARLKMKVEIPKPWIAVSNNFISSEKISDKRKIIVFKKTKKISTYLFHLSTGEYEFFEDHYKTIPLRIYFRRSLKKYVRHKEIFKLTKEGLGFFQKFFDYPFVFGKYYHVFVPEFNEEAMENPGCVTVTDSYFIKRKPTRTDKSDLANTILHEMVHMWFGDLVTMEWWNDLWLNESFADFLSYIAMSEATEFKDAWQDFYARKSWAYSQDQYSTTHPITSNAKDTDIAFSDFDGISYAKGAAVLKQLVFYIGIKNFQKGVRSYFKKYAWHNTDMKEFLRCLEKASRTNLKMWFDKWITTTGVNTISSRISLHGSKISSLKIVQKPSAKNNILRTHKTKIALFYNEAGESPGFVEEVVYKGKVTAVNEIRGQKKPDFVFLNYEDFDYVKERFDRGSLDFLIKNPGSIQDDLTKQMAYGDLWQMVKDADLDPRKFLDIILKYAPAEANLLSLQRMFSKVSTILLYYVNGRDFKKYCQRFFESSLWVLKSNAQSDIKGTWYNILTFVAMGIKKTDYKKLADILEGRAKFKNFILDQDKRWSTVTCLEAVGYKYADKFLKREKRRDKSDRGRKRAATAEVSNLKNKKRFWDFYLTGPQEGKSLDFLRETMSGFFWRNQKTELRKYVPLFFKEVKTIFEKQDKNYARAFFLFLSPFTYTQKDVLKESEEFLKSVKGQELLKKNMMESVDDLKRSIKVLEKYG